MQPTCHNFGPSALWSKRCVAPMRCQIFRSQNFRGATLEEEGSKGKPWKKKVPTTSREWSYLTTIFGHPRRERNAAWRLCFAKISAPKIFAAQVGESKFQRQTANATNLPQFWAFRVVIETLRSAQRFAKFFPPKISRRNPGGRRFQRQTLEEEGSNNTPRMKLTYHNFWPPTSRAKRSVAPMLRKNFRIQNFHGPSWQKQVPKTGRESNQLATIVGILCCDRNAA